ncbi:MAG: hemerythrin [Verrucomicrobia bacterium]|nr:hemerythrin [Verrucomicrobiota bacterium]
MKPTEILSAEHRVIEQVLNVLEKMAAQAEQTGALEKRDASDAVEFFRMFADKCHHGKEEAQLFPAMEAKGFPRDGGPTGVMIHEHEQGRRYVRAMADAIKNDNAKEFARNGRAFIELLRQHIQKEDHCLFSMADQAFSPADQASLLAAFEAVERDHMGAGTHEKFLKLANDLADCYGVAHATQAETEHACCCHH